MLWKKKQLYNFSESRVCVGSVLVNQTSYRFHSEAPFQSAIDVAQQAKMAESGLIHYVKNQKNKTFMFRNTEAALKIPPVVDVFFLWGSKKSRQDNRKCLKENKWVQWSLNRPVMRRLQLPPQEVKTDNKNSSDIWTCWQTAHVKITIFCTASQQTVITTSVTTVMEEHTTGGTNK